MIHLIPYVKSLEIKDGYLQKKAIFCNTPCGDVRLTNALKKLTQDAAGVPLTLEYGAEGEGYEIWVEREAIRVKGDGPAGAFYAIQTLRQIFTHETIPCLHIKDHPDFPYRGFYHDATRGKVPTVENMKWLIDQMAYYKMNSLQLYVEHVYEFEETKDLIEKTGYLTSAELKELDEYCKENFIEFIPSLSTFGHLFELLNQEKYAHLKVLKGYEASPNRWIDRMGHHTIDPTQEESIEIIKSLIDQYAPNFSSDIFNICCDETFDLTRVYKDTDVDEGQLYVDFVKKIIAHLQSKGKKVMMWADILLKHPETIEEIPDDIYFLNWNYRAEPPEENIIKFAELGRKQIVCPGTTIWNRFCENTAVAESNISKMAEYGYKHGAIGVLNTNWGDYGHTCSLELSMYGMVLGAAKSWHVATKAGKYFDPAVDHLLYQQEGAMSALREVSALNDMISYREFVLNYYKIAYPSTRWPRPVLKATIDEIQEAYKAIRERLENETWTLDEYRQEMLIAAEAICTCAELEAIYERIKPMPERLTDAENWLPKFREKWIAKNKESELSRIEQFFRDCEAMAKE